VCKLSIFFDHLLLHIILSASLDNVSFILPTSRFYCEETSLRACFGVCLRERTTIMMNILSPITIERKAFKGRRRKEEEK